MHAGPPPSVNRNTVPSIPKLSDQRERDVLCAMAELYTVQSTLYSPGGQYWSSVARVAQACDCTHGQAVATLKVSTQQSNGLATLLTLSIEVRDNTDEVAIACLVRSM
jgi:hypothetical protein